MNSRAKVAKNFCTTREAADILGVSVKTAQMWAENGLLEAWRTEGGHRRIVRASVERLLADEKSGAVSSLPSSSQPQPASGLALNAVPKTTSIPSRFRILVAEDEDNLRTLYSMQLARWSLAPMVTLVPDGYKALLEIGRHPPDLLIADLQMPEFDGFKMLRTLREISELQSMAIVVVTGLDADTIARRGGVPAGVQVLPKPIPFATLERIAQEVLALRTVPDALE